MSRKVYVAFGDSITDGYGVKKGFVSILTEQISKTHPDLDLVTINTGMSGDSLTTSVTWLSAYGTPVVEGS
jgi:lysophospholipase L1-like esterase